MNFKLLKTKSLKKIQKFGSFIFFLFILLSCPAQGQNEKIDIFFEKTLKGQEEKKSLEQNETQENRNPNQKRDNRTEQKKIAVELAISPKEKERGFMERKIIPEGTGMIFLYKEDRQMRFWMKNTPHPLSIAYIDSSGQIREIYDMAPYSLETVCSIHSVRYALEVPRGMFTRMGIEVGDRLTKESILLLKRMLKTSKD